MNIAKKKFTLVEILVVIGIIVILAAIILPAVGGATKKADQTKAKAQMTNLVNAIKQFEATYGYLPNVFYSGSTSTSLFTSSNPCKVDDSHYENLIRILQNEETSSTKVNKKKQQFLDVVGNVPGEYKDPWGNNYQIAISTDNTGKMSSSDIGTIDGLNCSGTLYQSVLVWSTGADADDNQDNVYSIPVVWDKSAKRYNIGR